jgi:DNA-binding IscR family transcriptional regulator
MKLTSRAIYALLFACFVARNKRSSTTLAARELNLDLHFLEQVARQMRLGGVIRSVRGPGGGYELAGEIPTAGEVLRSVNTGELLGAVEAAKLTGETVEARATSNLIGLMQLAINTTLKLPVTDLVSQENGKGYTIDPILGA